MGSPHFKTICKESAKHNLSICLKNIDFAIKGLSMTTTVVQQVINILSIYFKAFFLRFN